jgi:transcription factor WhiB
VTIAGETRLTSAGSELLPGPPPWVRQAACLGRATAERDPWHPPEQPASQYRALVAEAVAICAACPVQVQCGRYGLELLANDYVVAVYGAMDPYALRDIARRIGRPTRKMARHGTRARYVNFKCRCNACRAANARGEATRRAAKRGRRRECPAWTSWGTMCRQPAREISIFCAFHAIPDQPASANRF